MVAALTPITSSSKTVDYFTKDGYYAKDDLEHKKESYWHGRGALEELGFKGMVEPADFAAVMEGHLEKHDISLGRIRDGEREHRPGFDLTFTAPKSVSIEGLVFGKNPVIKAHQEAVKATLDFVEENFIETRTYDPSTKKSNRTPTGKMVAANFQHDTSRNLDPHLHTHCIIANMTINEKGEWRSIESTALNRHKKLIGSYYHNELARGLLEQGYELEGRMIGKLPGFEIAGYDRKEIDEFSTRRQEMLEYLSERGLPLTAKTAQIAVLATRAEKIEIPRHELQQQWAEKVAELEIEPQSWQSRKQNRDDYTIENDHANDNNKNIYDAITFALNDIETRHSVFPASELQSHVLGQLAGRITFDDLNKTINQMQADGHLIKAQRRGHDLAYVTETTLNTERSIIAHMNNGKDQVEPIRADFEATNADLTPDQNQAIEMVLTSPDKVIGIQGYAGTGKTTMLKTLANEAHDMKVIGLAPSTTATHVLMREAQIPANTLQHFLTKFGNIDQMDAPTLKEHQDNLSKTVLVVDESSMISTKQMNRLFNITEKLDIEHVVLVGDSKQLRSIEAGQPFRQLQEHGMSISLMDTIMRQKDPSLKLAVEAVLDGNITRSLEHLEPNLIESFNLGRDAANIWLELDKDTRENTLILAPTHDLRDDINTTIRDSLKMENTLSGPEMEQERLINRHMTPYQKSEAHNYNEGDVLVFHNDALNYRIEKDDHYTVMAAGRDSHIQVENNLGEARQIKTNSTVRYNYNVYEPMEINLQAGDAIRFTRNNKEHDIVNGGTAEITEITPSKLHLTDDDGKQMSFRHDDKVLQHLDHDYSRTVHAAQGMTADHVIAVLDSGHGQLTDQQSFYVEISRARESAIVLTDNIVDLTETLEKNTGEKMTAMEAVGEVGTALEKDEIIERPELVLDKSERDEPKIIAPEITMLEIDGSNIIVPEVIQPEIKTQGVDAEKNNSGIAQGELTLTSGSNPGEHTPATEMAQEEPSSNKAVEEKDESVQVEIGLDEYGSRDEYDSRIAEIPDIVPDDINYAAEEPDFEKAEMDFSDNKGLEEITEEIEKTVEEDLNKDKGFEIEFDM